MSPPAASSSSSIDHRNGFCTATKTFHSLRPSSPLPSPSLPFSFPSFALSLLPSSPLPANPAFIDASTGASLSYPDFISQFCSLASSLRFRFRLRQGAVAFVLSPPRLDVPVLYFALLSLGVVFSPANPASSPSELSHQIALVKPSIIFATSNAAVSGLAPETPLVLLDSPLFLALLDSTTPESDAPPVIQQSDDAVIMFSSGTTGKVKGVLLSHRNLIATVMGMPRTAGAVTMVTVPVFHIYGFTVVLKGVTAGETVVVMTEKFEVRSVLASVERFQVNNLYLAPPALLRIVRECGEGENLKLNSLERVLCGGGPIGVALIWRFLARFPNVILGQGYGLTETSSGIFRTLGPEESQRIGSTGRLISNYEAKIVDPSTGIPLSPCEQGELWVRGPTIMKGYVRSEEATSAILDSEGWLKTGDLCYIDNDGFLFVVDRLKELIKCKGYQVAPAELEGLLQKHTDVVEAAVIPYPDEEAGEVPMAFIVRKRGSALGKTEIMESIAKQVAPYKKICRISFVHSIPKNPSGKILRKELKRRATMELNSRL